MKNCIHLTVSNIDLLDWSDFKVINIIRNGSALLASLGDEFDKFDEDLQNVSQEEFIRSKRQKLENCLGLASIHGLDSRSLGKALQYLYII